MLGVRISSGIAFVAMTTCEYGLRQHRRNTVQVENLIPKAGDHPHVAQVARHHRSRQDRRRLTSGREIPAQVRDSASMWMHHPHFVT